jgi:hypothetical protein
MVSNTLLAVLLRITQAAVAVTYKTLLILFHRKVAVVLAAAVMRMMLRVV